MGLVLTCKFKTNFFLLVLILGECYMLPHEDQATSKNRTHLSMKLPHSILFCFNKSGLCKHF
ncbi:hypothetical protein HanPI659440_Chr07g0254621 [Helianthus annuus]|nr:hypothetical protein HanHA300_Chr07g0233241 [Helianthus annuus]KAJ0562359.1 hypothetical protein HanHA89_Chr07g0250411 [Helianthus annuus]KAJ0727735.1 hypothetical protein HanLR1_Chr07g0233191 [Helianthus annuus]KAJ0730534.1 hypothetical protein HanOQP8_Chr07g0241141 [Helianthus annuus]KAJ0770211.1 hypothetical protein HanPI659440_Chr07g0254621 [Helianthus annuus]